MNIEHKQAKVNFLCPVCEHQISGEEVCPNCDARLENLILLNSLEEVVESKAQQYSTRKTVILLLIITGVLSALFYFLNSYYARLLTQVTNGIEQNSISFTKLPIAQGTKDLQPRRYHIVQQGDSLSSIAQKYLGNANRWPELVIKNPHLSSRVNQIDIGEKIRID
ncbi:LysM peptidoglycan-binding domain-containing protein [Thermosynechococcus sp. FA-CM-4201]